MTEFVKRLELQNELNRTLSGLESEGHHVLASVSTGGPTNKPIAVIIEMSSRESEAARAKIVGVFESLGLPVRIGLSANLAGSPPAAVVFDHRSGPDSDRDGGSSGF